MRPPGSGRPRTSTGRFDRPTLRAFEPVTDAKLRKNRLHGYRKTRITEYSVRMTMLSFRVEDGEAAEAQRWAESLGIDRSELLREALRRHLNLLASQGDAERWKAEPLDEGERALAAIADWGPAEDWSDWADAAR